MNVMSISSINATAVAHAFIAACNEKNDDKIAALFSENVIVRYSPNSLDELPNKIVILNHTESDSDNGNIWTGQFRAFKTIFRRLEAINGNTVTITFAYQLANGKAIAGTNHIKVNADGLIEEFECNEADFQL